VVHTISLSAFLAALLAACWSWWRARRVVREELAGLPAPWLPVLFLLPWALLVAWLPPHAPWETMTHELERYADLRDLDYPINLQHLHGPGFLGTVGAVRWLSGGLISPFAANAAMAGLAGLALFLAGWWQARRWEVAWGTLGAFLLAPVVVRLAPTLSLYLPAVALLAVALAAWSLWGERDDDDVFTAAVACSAAAMCCRADFLVFVPGVVGSWWLLLHPSRLRALSGRRWLVLAGGGLVVAARVVELLDSADARSQGGPPLMVPERLGPWLVLLVATIGLVHLRLPGGRRPWEVVSVPVAVALVVAAVVQLVARVVPPDLARTSPFWHAGYTSPAWWGFAGLGLIGLVLRRPREAVWLVCVLCGGAALVAASVDSSSTWVRTSLSTWPFLALLVGHGVGVLGAAGRRAGAMGAAAAVAVFLATAGQGVVAHADWIGWVYPRQAEFLWLQRVRAQLPAGARVAFLTWRDVPDITSELYPQLAQRGAIARFLGGENQAVFDPVGGGTPLGPLQPWTLQSLGEALADEDLSVPRYYLRTLDCARALLRLDQQTAVYGDREGPLEAPVNAELYRPELDLERHAAVRAVHGVDVFCARVEQRFVLEPVDVVPLQHGHIGHPREQIYGEEPHLGLYRIVGIRAAQGVGTR
jgi:hypothetical protein